MQRQVNNQTAAVPANAPAGGAHLLWRLLSIIATNSGNAPLNHHLDGRHLQQLSVAQQQHLMQQHQHQLHQLQQHQQRPLTHCATISPEPMSTAGTTPTLTPPPRISRLQPDSTSQQQVSLSLSTSGEDGQPEQLTTSSSSGRSSSSSSSSKVQAEPVQQQQSDLPQAAKPAPAPSAKASSSSAGANSGKKKMAKQRRMYKCRHCSFETDKKVENWKHIRIHMRPEKLLACDSCQFVTEYKHHLEYHQRNHSGYKPFKCDSCDYQCVNKSMLNSHMKSHSSVYQYQCGDCKYATKYVHSLKMHLRKYNHHPAQLMIDVYGRKRGPKSSTSSSSSSTNEQQCILDLRVDSKLVQ